jgi:hypothetical protein
MICRSAKLVTGSTGSSDVTAETNWCCHWIVIKLFLVFLFSCTVDGEEVCQAAQSYKPQSSNRLSFLAALLAASKAGAPPASLALRRLLSCFAHVVSSATWSHH